MAINTILIAYSQERTLNLLRRKENENIPC